MEREGYPDGYDKNEVYVKEEDRERIAMQERLQDTREKKKKRLWVNLAEFIVGLVLLGFSWQYLQHHPAEKVSLMSGVDVIVTKVRGVLNSQSKVQKEIATLSGGYAEVIKAAKQGECLDEADILRLQQVYDKLGGLEGSDFENQKAALTQYLGAMYQKVKNGCKQ